MGAGLSYGLFSPTTNDSLADTLIPLTAGGLLIFEKDKKYLRVYITYGLRLFILLLSQRDSNSLYTVPSFLFPPIAHRTHAHAHTAVSSTDFPKMQKKYGSVRVQVRSFMKTKKVKSKWNIWNESSVHAVIKICIWIASHQLMSSRYCEWEAFNKTQVLA